MMCVQSLTLLFQSSATFFCTCAKQPPLSSRHLSLTLQETNIHNCKFAEMNTTEGSGITYFQELRVRNTGCGRKTNKYYLSVLCIGPPEESVNELAGWAAVKERPLYVNQ